MIEQRALKGAFVTLYSDLREDDKKFFNYFRMSIRSFDEFLGNIEASLMVSNYGRVSISPIERLCVTLR